MQSLKQAILDAGLELYGEDDVSVRLAERHRYHLMDAGVEVRREPGGYRIVFVARAQRSDFPRVEPARIFAAVRAQVGGAAHERGYVAARESVTNVFDPMNDTKVLDVWYELTFEKLAPDVTTTLDELRWVLPLEKYVRPDA